MGNGIGAGICAIAGAMSGNPFVYMGAQAAGSAIDYVVDKDKAQARASRRARDQRDELNKAIDAERKKINAHAEKLNAAQQNFETKFNEQKHQLKQLQEFKQEIAKVYKYCCGEPNLEDSLQLLQAWLAEEEHQVKYKWFIEHPMLMHVDADPIIIAAKNGLLQHYLLLKNTGSNVLNLSLDDIESIQRLDLTLIVRQVDADVKAKFDALFHEHDELAHLKTVLSYVAFMDLSDIPLDILSEHLHIEKQDIANIISVLKEYSIISSAVDENMLINLPALAGKYLRDNYHEDASKDIMRGLLDMYVEHFQYDKLDIRAVDEEEKIGQAKKLVAHLIAIIEQIKTDEFDAQVMELQRRLACYYTFAVRDYHKGEYWYSRLYKLQIKYLDKDDIELARTLINHSSALRLGAPSKTPESIAKLQEALRIVERCPQDYFRLYVVSLVNLLLTLCSAEKTPILQRLLDFFDGDQFPSENTDIYYAYALIFRVDLNHDHNDMYKQLRDNLLERAKRQFGNGGIEYANIQWLCFNHAKAVKSIELALENLSSVLKIQEAFYPAQSMVIANTLYSLAGLYQHKAEYEQEIDCLERVLPIYQQRFGENSIDYVAVLRLLGCAYFDNNQANKAQQVFETCLTLLQRCEGDNRIDTVKALMNLANTHGMLLKDPQKQLQLLQQAIDLQLAVKGKVDNSFSNLYTNLGSAYGDLADIDKQIEYQEQSLQMDIAQYGEVSLDVALVQYNLSQAYYNNENYDQAVAYIEKSWHIRKELYGEDHKSTLLAKKRLDNYREKQHENEQAQQQEHQPPAPNI